MIKKETDVTPVLSLHLKANIRTDPRPLVSAAMIKYFEAYISILAEWRKKEMLPVIHFCRLNLVRNMT